MEKHMLCRTRLTQQTVPQKSSPAEER